MSIKVTGTDERLSLRLPTEGEGWKRQGNEMVSTPFGGSANSQDQFLQQSGAIDPTKAHTEVEGDALDPSAFTLAAGTTDGFQKSIRCSGNGAGGITITAALRIQGGVGTQPTNITFDATGQGALLMWQAASSKWVILQLLNGADVTLP